MHPTSEDALSSLLEQVVLGHKTSFEALKTQLAPFTGTEIVRSISIDANLKRIRSIPENIGCYVQVSLNLY